MDDMLKDTKNLAIKDTHTEQDGKAESWDIFKDVKVEYKGQKFGPDSDAVLAGYAYRGVGPPQKGAPINVKSHDVSSASLEKVRETSLRNTLPQKIIVQQKEDKPEKKLLQKGAQKTNNESASLKRKQEIQKDDRVFKKQIIRKSTGKIMIFQEEIDKLHDEYVMRGGFSGKVLDRRLFDKAIPARYRLMTQTLSLSDLETSITLAEQPRIPQTVQVSTPLTSFAPLAPPAPVTPPATPTKKTTPDFVSLPASNTEFVKEMAKEVRRYSEDGADQLVRAAARFPSFSKRAANIAKAKGVLRKDVARLDGEIRKIREVKSSVQIAGERTRDAVLALENVEQELSVWRDTVHERTQALR